MAIPQNVSSIGDEAFWICKSLASISVHDKNGSYASKDGVLYDKQFTTLAQYPGGKRDTSFVIPSTVTIIGSAAFDSNEVLKSITIPNGVTQIDDKEFKYCSALTSIVIPDTVTRVGDEAFKYCESMESVVISENMTEISSQMFKHCDSLKRIYIPATLLR